MCQRTLVCSISRRCQDKLQPPRVTVFPIGLLNLSVAFGFQPKQTKKNEHEIGEEGLREATRIRQVSYIIRQRLSSVLEVRVEATILVCALLGTRPERLIGLRRTVIHSASAMGFLQYICAGYEGCWIFVELQFGICPKRKGQRQVEIEETALRDKWFLAGDRLRPRAATSCARARTCVLLSPLNQEKWLSPSSLCTCCAVPSFLVLSKKELMLCAVTTMSSVW